MGTFTVRSKSNEEWIKETKPKRSCAVSMLLVLNSLKSPKGHCNPCTACNILKEITRFLRYMCTCTSNRHYKVCTATEPR